MSDGERLGSGQSMNRNLPRNRTPPQTVPLPSSELPQLVPPPSGGGVRWMDRSTDNRSVGTPPPPPDPRLSPRPPRNRTPSAPRSNQPTTTQRRENPTSRPTTSPPRQPTNEAPTSATTLTNQRRRFLEALGRGEISPGRSGLDQVRDRNLTAFFESPVLPGMHISQDDQGDFYFVTVRQNGTVENVVEAVPRVRNVTSRSNEISDRGVTPHSPTLPAPPQYGRVSSEANEQLLWDRETGRVVTDSETSETTDAYSSPPAPRPPARPPRSRRPPNQRPTASPPDEAFPRLADGRAIQVPTQEIVGEVPQTDVAAERSTVGQRATAEPQWQQIIQERYEERDRIQGIFGYGPPAPNQTHPKRRGWPVGTIRQGGGYLLPNGMWVLPNVDGTPFIDPITGHITSPRRPGARDATTHARRELESLVEPYQESGIGHFIGIPYGIVSEILAVLDSLAALEEAIRDIELDEVKSFLVVLGQELARNPQLLNELPVEIVKSQLVDISNHFRQAVEDSNRTVDSSAHITRGFVKIIELLEPLHAVFNTRVGRRIAERISRLREQLATTVRNAPLPVPGVGAGGLGVVPVKRGRTGRPSQPVGQGVSQPTTNTSTAQVQVNNLRGENYRSLPPRILTGETAGTGGINSIRAGEIRTEGYAALFIIEGRIFSRPQSGFGRLRNFNERFRRRPSSLSVEGVRLTNYEYSHLWGPRWGDEAQDGIMLAPSRLNQVFQNHGIETRIDELAATIESLGGRTYVTARAKSFPRERMRGLRGRELLLQEVEYEVFVDIPGITNGREGLYRASVAVDHPSIGGRVHDPEITRLRAWHKLFSH